ncbi:MAG: lytic transglycosylase domain-containing protein [Deltaproteobacteria bacterium]|nr:lytic transglycosylase domain-containing protein [Deltaproteobacteria bacterium]
MKKFKKLIVILCSVIVASPLDIPIDLVGRVEFWIKVFGETSKYQRIIHHRWYPQCIFTTIDFVQEASLLSPSSLKSLIDLSEQESISRVKSSLLKIRDNKKLDTIFDLNVNEVVESCLKKYRSDAITWTINEDLVRTQSGVKEKTKVAIERSNKYLWFIENTLKTYGVPDDIKFLPFVESSFNVHAVSKAGAVGMWQFMPSTARIYGLTINKYVDERKDPYKSTVAAAQYLKDAYNVFGSWPHALISYNHGVTGLKEKITKLNLGLDLVKLIENPYNRALGFASTNFYPSFVAVVHIFKNYKNFFTDIVLDQPKFFEKHYLAKQLSIYSLSTATGLSKDQLLEYNPQFTPAVKAGRLALPVHTLVYLPHGVKINYSKVQEISKKSKKQKK